MCEGRSFRAAHPPGRLIGAYAPFSRVLYIYNSRTWCGPCPLRPSWRQSVIESMDGVDKKLTAADKERLPLPAATSEPPVHSTRGHSWVRSFRLLLVVLGFVSLLSGRVHPTSLEFVSGRSWPISFTSIGWSSEPDDFFYTSTRTDELCPSVANASSYSGWIGLDGDSEDTPKRSFYWLVFHLLYGYV